MLKTVRAEGAGEEIQPCHCESLWKLAAILMYYCHESKIPWPGIEPNTSCVLTTGNLHHTTEAKQLCIIEQVFNCASEHNYIKYIISGKNCRIPGSNTGPWACTVCPIYGVDVVELLENFAMLCNSQSGYSISSWCKNQTNPAKIFSLSVEFVDYCQSQNLISVRTYQTNQETTKI